MGTPTLDQPANPWRQPTAGERAFDQLNPDYAVVADTRDPLGHQAMQQREAGPSLGPRTAIALSRENDPNPVLAIQGQDYRAAEAVRAARERAGIRWGRHLRPERQRDGRKLQRTGTER
jgi:hypothetical protein